MKHDTRNIIIKTASKLFYEKGYNLTGINEIIEKSGIAKATLYNHFRSKEDLLLAYLDAQDLELLTNIRVFCDDKPQGNPRLIAVLEFLIPFFNQENFNGCWCMRSIAEVPRENQKVRAKIKENKQAFLDYIKLLVSENRGELEAENQNQLSKQLYLLYEGAMTESHIHQEIWPIEMAISLLKSKMEMLD